MRRLVAAIGALLVLGGVTVAATAVAGAVTPDATASQVEEGDNGTDFGHEVAAFMQTSASDANASVDAGMFRAEMTAAEDPEAPVGERIQRLETRMNRLQQRAASLDGDGNRSSIVHTARASSVHADIANLRRAIEDARAAASERGVNASRLDDLRTRASNMTGPEVADAARRLTRAPGPPAHAGPPADRGPPENGGPPDGAGPGEVGGPPGQAGGGNGSDPGPPADAGGSGNGSSPGAPGDSGNRGGNGDAGGPNDGGPGNDDGGDGDSGGEAGPGNGGGPGDDPGNSGGSDDGDDGGPGNGGGPGDDSGNSGGSGDGDDGGPGNGGGPPLIPGPL